MERAIKETQKHFESLPGRTPEYLAWHRLFKRELTDFLTFLGCTKIDIRRPKHFDITGYFTAVDDQIWYFTISDVRWSKENMLVRTAKSYGDSTSGRTYRVSLKTEEDFKQGMERLLLRKNRPIRWAVYPIMA